MSDVDELRRATARITTAATTGTGFFVAPGLLVTCGHVAGATGDNVTLYFRDGTEAGGKVLDRDDAADIAVIKTDATGWPSLPLQDATEGYRENDWLAYGFPRVAKNAPVLIEGEIRLVDTTDSKLRAALQLYSDDSAAGNGAYLDGFSGSAVLSRGRVVGQLRSTPKDKDGGAQLGAVYATPAAAIRALAARYEPNLLVRRRRDPQPPNAPYDPTWYIHRPDEEKDAADDLDARKPVVVVGPQFFGKSSLLQCIVESARNRERQNGRDTRLVDVDLGVLGTQATTPLNEFLVTFFEAVLLGLNKDPEPALKQYAPSGRMSGPMASSLMQRLLSESSDPFYLVLSRAEALVEWKPLLDAFAQLLRAWVSQGAFKEPFRLLRIVAEFSTAPALVTENMPSFNIAPEPLVIEDLNMRQTVELAALYELDWRDAELTSLRNLVGGHPYLLRRAMFEAARDQIEVGKIIENAMLDGGVFRDFLEDNIGRIRAAEALRVAACMIACGKRPPANPPNAVDKLCAAGIVRRVRGRIGELSLAYPIFAQHIHAVCEL
ncbi:MAG TPA: AAA-like domain-containing protein [Kofleriaceae bacterium]|nr:AAA-like domain-containing protein [Kofleriaceae bacterium]